MEAVCNEEGIKVEVCDNQSDDITSHDNLLQQISLAKQNTNKALQIAQQIFLHSSPQQSDVFDSVAGPLVHCVESLDSSLQALQSLQVKLVPNSQQNIDAELEMPVKNEPWDTKFDLRKCSVKIESLNWTKDKFCKKEAAQDDSIDNNDQDDQDEVINNMKDPLAVIDHDQGELEVSDVKEVKPKIKRKLGGSSIKIKSKTPKKRNNDIERPFSCNKCVRTFARKFDLQRHEQKHLTESSSEEEDISKSSEELNCTRLKCNFICFNPKYLNDHINGELKYRKCPWCKHFIRSGDKELMRHMKKRHHEKAKHKTALVCFVCEAKFDRTDRYDTHVSKKHELGSLFHCPLKNCEYTSTILVDMRTHIKMKDILKFDCTDCKFKAETELKLQNHVDLHHISVNCDVCSEQFNSKLSLDLHNIQAHNATPKAKRETVCCDICGVTLAKQKLKTHKRDMHDPTKDWSCNICNMKAKNGRSLTRHKAKVHGEKKFLCDMCPFAATTREKLRIHMNRIRHPKKDSSKDTTTSTNNKLQIQEREGDVNHVSNSAMATVIRNQVEPGTSIPCQYCDYKAADHLDLIHHFSSFHNI